MPAARGMSSTTVLASRINQHHGEDADLSRHLRNGRWASGWLRGELIQPQASALTAGAGPFPARLAGR